MTETNEDAPKPLPKSTGSGSECATDILSAADDMHAYLLAQVDSLMGAPEGSDDARVLGRIAALVEAYVQARWPISDESLQHERGSDGPTTA